MLRAYCRFIFYINSTETVFAVDHLSQVWNGNFSHTMNFVTLLFTIIAFMITLANAGPAAYATCQAACAAGATMGGPAAVAMYAACQSAYYCRMRQ